MSSELLKLYRAPFTMDKYHIYIHDADHHMVADFSGGHSGDYTFRPRGWGRFQYMEQGDVKHDAMEKFLFEVVKDCRNEPVKCLAAINQAWEVSNGEQG